jgi:HSP20 family molecular chaperone IbpA
MEKTEKDTNSLRRLIENIEKTINDGQKKVKDSLNKLKNSNILESDWISILSVTSNPIMMDFLIEGIPQVYYDVFDNDEVVEIVLDISDVAKEDIRIRTRYKTIKIYIKDYLVKKIDLKKYLKKSIRVKNVNCQYKGRILKIRIKK